MNLCGTWDFYLIAEESKRGNYWIKSTMWLWGITEEATAEKKEFKTIQNQFAVNIHEGRRTARSTFFRWKEQHDEKMWTAGPAINLFRSSCKRKTELLCSAFIQCKKFYVLIDISRDFLTEVRGEAIVNRELRQQRLKNHSICGQIIGNRYWNLFRHSVGRATICKAKMYSLLAIKP